MLWRDLRRGFRGSCTVRFSKYCEKRQWGVDLGRVGSKILFASGGVVRREACRRAWSSDLPRVLWDCKPGANPGVADRLAGVAAPMGVSLRPMVSVRLGLGSLTIRSIALCEPLREASVSRRLRRRLPWQPRSRGWFHVAAGFRGATPGISQRPVRFLNP
jgi:hypothetical protein